MGEMALKSVCLDTDVLIDHLRGDERATRKIEELEDAGSLLSTTTINAFELYYGAQKTGKREENVDAVRRLLSRLLVFDFGERAAERAGEIAAQLEEDGLTIGFRDVLIGATAIINNSEFLTKNIRHFERIRELKLHPPNT